jgi:hypothetical protein
MNFQFQHTKYNTVIVFLDITHGPVFYLKQRLRTGVCLRSQVEPIELDPIIRVSHHLRRHIPVCLCLRLQMERTELDPILSSSLYIRRQIPISEMSRVSWINVMKGVEP